jgi:hypothetical protein
MARGDNAPYAEAFGVQGMILGLAGDLADLRSGKISVEDARTRAELAKQYFNGLRLMINARKSLENEARQIPQGGS